MRTPTRSTRFASLLLSCLFSTALACQLVPAAALADVADTGTGAQDAQGSQDNAGGTDGTQGQDAQQEAQDSAGQQDAQQQAAKKKVKPAVTYRVDCKKGSWGSVTQGKQVAGKEIWSSEVERLRVKVQGPYAGGVKYAVRTVGEDWDSWSKNNDVAGTNKEPLEAVKIKLTGKMAKHYHIYYRVYVAEHGWLGWAHDGQKAGTGTTGYPIGAITMRLVKDGKSTPTPVKKHFTAKYAKKGGTEWTLNQKAQSLSSPTDWLIVLNRTKCYMAVFKGKKGAWKMKRAFVCSCGAPATPTPTGTYKIDARFSPLGESYNAYYAIRVHGNIHMHSIIYWPGGYSVKDGRLGKHVSHGCIRIELKNIRWIYKTLPDDSVIHIY